MNFIKIGRNKLACNCGSEIFITFGDYTITTVECVKCHKQTEIVKTKEKIEKLLSEFGEDYCRVYGKIVNDKAKIKHLIFIGFNTKVALSARIRIKMKNQSTLYCYYTTIDIEERKSV